ncbi:MAG: cysteine desulfurase family protein [Verrucomicrobiia bacterium]|jgi:cysteine desulfurase
MNYFDYNATTPVLPEARAAWLDATERFVGNPSSLHRMGARADRALTEAREQMAEFLGCHALDVVWTSSATESNNMAVAHYAGSLPPESEIWISAIEHPCVLESARRYFPGRHRIIPVGREGAVDSQWLADELKSDRPGMVAVMAANNETGVLQPWREVLALCRAQGVPFFCDAAQWVGKLPSKGLGECDFVSGCAHKFGGPKGAGFLKVPAKGGVGSLLVGGSQEEGRRAGTENVAGVISMVAALALRELQLTGEGVAAKLVLREAFEEKVLAALPGSEIVGGGEDRLWNTVSALMPEADCRQRWVVKLDKAGFAVSTGSACASGKEASSHVLAAMGRDASEASRVLRFSGGWETRAEDWEDLLAALVAVNETIQEPAPARASERGL